MRIAMTHVPHSILAAVDFGDASARAVAAAGLIAERCRGTLTILHAETMEAPAYFTSEQLDALERQRHALEVQAEQFLVRFGGRHTPVRFSAVLDKRPPVDAIVHASEAADLVVMGTHGRHGPKRWWLGSVAERVLREISRPLLIVRAGTDKPIEALFDKCVVHAAAAPAGTGSFDYPGMLAPCFGGKFIDAREDPIESAVRRTGATILIVEAPYPRTPEWLSTYGEPLLQFCTVPILFVPAMTEGVTL